MKDTEQAIEFIDNALNGLEKSVAEKNDTKIKTNQQEFNSLISEYRKVIGRKSVNTYTQNYAEIMENGGYLK